MDNLAETFYEIYELTYKYQMLKLEMERGDYGLPSQLPDTAYLRFEQVKDRLSNKLDRIYPELIETYEHWLDSHHLDNIEEEDLIWDVYTRALYTRDLVRDEWPLNIDQFIGDIAYALDSDNNSILYLEDEFKKYISSIAPPEVKHEIENASDQYIEYFDPKDIDLLVDKFMNEVVYPLAVKYGKEYYSEMEEVYNRIDNVYSRLLNWDSYDLDEKILIFQEALTTAHHNGSMATWLFEDNNAVEFLDNLSAMDTTKWDQELASWLGYEPGSRLTATGKLDRVIIKLGGIMETLVNVIRKAGKIRGLC